MKHITIDNLEHIPESATFQDLRYLHGTGRSKTSIGAYGRKHSDYRFGAQTEIGDIEISVWEAAMHRLIRNSGEEALYQALLAWVEADMVVDIYNVLNRLGIGSIDGKAICRQLIDTFSRNILRHTGNALQIIPHSLKDVPVVALECCPQHTEVPNDPGILIFFKRLIPLHLRGLMLIFKDMERNTDEICELGDHHIGTILI